MIGNLAAHAAGVGAQDSAVANSTIQQVDATVAETAAHTAGSDANESGAINTTLKQADNDEKMDDNTPIVAPAPGLAEILLGPLTADVVAENAHAQAPATAQVMPNAQIGADTAVETAQVDNSGGAAPTPRD